MNKRIAAAEHERRMRALRALSPDEQDILKNAASDLAKKLRQVGNMSAWELIEAIGVFLARYDQETILQAWRERHDVSAN